MIAEINNLIPLLDKDKDALLIGLLQHRLHDAEYRGHAIITEENISNAKKGLTQTLHNYIYSILSNTDRFKKAEKIYDRNLCSDCKYSIKKEYTRHDGEICEYFDFDNTPKCNRCCERKEIFENIINIDYYDMISNLLNSDEVKHLVLCKAAINQIKTKLKNYATS